MGTGRFSNCSMLEAIELCEKISGWKLNWRYLEDNRNGDRPWWISDRFTFRLIILHGVLLMICPKPRGKHMK